MNSLPKPDYRPDASDPDWLAYAVQFHGHLGPWAAAGLRAGMAARREAQAEGFFDVAVVVEGPLVKPPESCFLDGLQVSTGATLGKRNLTWTDAEQLAVLLKNTRTGAVVEVCPTTALWQMLTSLKTTPRVVAAPALYEADVDRDEHRAAHHSAEDRARQIARMTEASLFHVTILEQPASSADAKP